MPFDIGDVRRSSLIIIIIIYYLFLIVYNIPGFPFVFTMVEDDPAVNSFPPPLDPPHTAQAELFSHTRMSFGGPASSVSSAAVTTVGRKIVLPVFRRKLRHCAVLLKNPLSYCLQLFCSSLISHKKLSFIEISKSGQLSKASTDLFNVLSTTQYQTVVFATIFPSCPSSHIQRTFIFSFGRCVRLCD